MKNHSAPALLLLTLVATCLASASPPAPLRFAGIAFVDSSITGQGSRTKLPAGAKIYPPGSKITGTDGCPTNQYGTDGLIVAVIDYEGRPTAAGLTVTRHPAGGGSFENAPYYLDINAGRTLQFLGPIRENGRYDMRLEAGLGRAGSEQMKASAFFTLARTCGSRG